MLGVFASMSDDFFSQKSDGARSPKNKMRARCPSCSAWVNLRDTAEVWDLVDCPECNTQLEIVDLRPPTLDYASSELEEEDWEEDEDWESFDRR
jgi:alpha-aminoadipate carrier protein LysW